MRRTERKLHALCCVWEKLPFSAIKGEIGVKLLPGSFYPEHYWKTMALVWQGPSVNQKQKAVREATRGSVKCRVIQSLFILSWTP